MAGEADPERLPAETGTTAAYVDGRLIIAPTSPSLAGASAHIVLEEVSRADAAAAVVAETYLTGIEHQPGSDAGTALPFRLAVPAATAIRPQHRYNVRVWLDSDGDGRPGPGDLYSDQSYPVLTRGHGHTVAIVLGA